MPPKRQVQEKPTGARNLQPPSFLLRFVPHWGTPQWQNANSWRRVVRQQPLCIVCRDTLISFLIGTDWQIRAKNPNDTDLYRTEIDYYVELFETSDGMDFDTRIDLLGQDILDTPFGGAIELGRLGDLPDGRAVWLQHIDAATLYPTNDFDFPVAQRVPGAQHPPILFPRHTIDRSMYSPRPEWDRKGWGMAPPEKVYLAIDLLFRGDRYYANLLLDTPEAGILDLMDMSQSAAEEWLDSFQKLFAGADPFKVPILYEHETPAKFIPFGRPPTEMIFDSVTFKYAQIVCAGYGLRISDIGLAAEASNTLAGVIRAERQTRRTGFATLKAKTSGWANRILPQHLEFEWLDQDDEALISKGRARLANFQAYAEAREKKMLHLEEIRAQIATDGLLNIQIDPDDTAGLELLDPIGAAEARPPRTDRDRVPPSEGGEGELTFPRKSIHSLLSNSIEEAAARATGPRLRRLFKVIARSLYPSASTAFKEFDQEDIETWADAMVANSFGIEDPFDLGEPVKKAITKWKNIINPQLKSDRWWSIKASLDEEDIKAAMAEVYEAGYMIARSFVAGLLYEEGELDSPEPVQVTLPLEHPSKVPLVEMIDSETNELIKAVVLASVCESFAVPTVAAAIRSGTTVEELLGNDDFMEMASRGIGLSIQEVFRSRLQLVVDQVSDEIVAKATSDFFDKIGLKEGWSRENGKLRVTIEALLKAASRKNFKI